MYYTYIQCDGGRKGDRRGGREGCRERGSDSGGVGGKGRRTMDESVLVVMVLRYHPQVVCVTVCVCSSDPTPRYASTLPRVWLCRV